MISEILSSANTVYLPILLQKKTQKGCLRPAPPPTIFLRIKKNVFDSNVCRPAYGFFHDRRYFFSYSRPICCDA